ncbi:MAG: indolepyruvate ferredoxin oxidoreductase subunit alpha [Dehalococcoidales bacterium]|nr:indolepyruvate ferredoxin oxidoreductase subunit alpha [Dehalococcoidales bacterium]
MNKVADITITSNAPGATLFMLGNEAIARGAIEAGVQVVAAYPGTPSSEITAALVEAAAELDMYAEWSINEKVALEVAMAGAISGLRSLSIMKHVGVNVAHDALTSASYMGLGGLVLISADDPGQWSSQNEQDNRYIARQAYIPVLEPCSAQEAKDMMADAFRLSEEYGQMFMVRSVTRIGHARSDVVLGGIEAKRKQGKFVKNPQKLVCLPANFRVNRRLLIQRMSKIKAIADTLPYNHLTLKKDAKLGVIASGISYGYALEAIKWMRLEDKVSVLKIGTPYPIPEKLTKRLLESVREVLVVEELEPFVEDAVRIVAQENNLTVKIHGKGLIPLAGELSTRQVAEALSKLTGARPPVDFAEIDKLRQETNALLPIRPPTMCAGCPHRASLYAINIASRRYQQETGKEPVKTSDIGCYALGANEPLNADDVAICMGGAFGIANGLAHTIDAPVVAHLGDSTFFHSGIPPMINAVYNRANITMVVLDNSTTGMTGFQPHPGASGDTSHDIKIEDIALASGVKFVEVIDAFDLPRLIDVLEKAIKFEGPSVVVARRLCSILDQRVKRRAGEKTVPYIVDPEKCLSGSPPYCQATCPLHIDIRGYIGLIKEGKFDEALALIKETLPFPSIIGRVCTRPCEAKCKRSEVEEPIAINALKRAAADFGKYKEDYSIAVEKKQKVAIVGGGPAGMMAAYDLRKMGYQVTIFEALSKLGGMMAVGIPEFRLPRDVISKETVIISKLGVEIRLNTRVGKDITLAELKKGYHAVFIAAGAHKGRSLGIANDGAAGIIDGTEFLYKVNTGEKVDVADKVVVVGGGNVAVDCARTCVRLGFKDVNIVYRRSRAEMPAIADEVNEAEHEGVKLTLLSGPNKVVVKDGKVAGLECLKIKLGEPDASGRRRPVQVTGSEFVIGTGLIIAAVGEEPDLAFMTGSDAKAVSKGYIKADPVTLASDVKGVFAGGDVVTGAATVIQALAAGRKAAKSIDKYLKGEPLNQGREGEDIFESKLIVDTWGILEEQRTVMPVLPVAQRKGNFKEVETGLTKEKAIQEAGRCLQCDCKICIDLLGCPALITDKGKVAVDAAGCPGCGVCAQVCPHGAIKAGE